jgi:hypothetical protein
MARIIVAGYIARFPLAGQAWAHLQYLLGLQALGHDVTFFEDAGWPDACYDPEQGTMGDDAVYGIRVLKEWLGRFGLDGCWVFRSAQKTYSGLSQPAAHACIAEADVLINLSGVTWFEGFEQIPARAFVDEDPLFTQVRVATDRDFSSLLNSHQALFSYGHNIGLPGCGIPTAGLSWQPFQQPIVLDQWPFACVQPAGGRSSPSAAANAAPRGARAEGIASRTAVPAAGSRAPTGGKSSPSADFAEGIASRTAVPAAGSRAPADTFTTILSWNAYGGVEFEGRTYGPKSMSFPLVAALPACSPQRFELAVSGEDVPTSELAASGWTIRDPLAVSRSLESYRQYIAGSRGEFSIAKHGYVASRSGWFSDRSAAYLASGRPVVLQDTGYSAWLPVGEGLLAFDDLDGAVGAVAAVNGNYERHRHSARAIAEEYFDARRVLGSLLERL